MMRVGFFDRLPGDKERPNQHMSRSTVITPESFCTCRTTSRDQDVADRQWLFVNELPAHLHMMISDFHAEVYLLDGQVHLLLPAVWVPLLLVYVLHFFVCFLSACAVGCPNNLRISFRTRLGATASWSSFRSSSAR